MKQIISSIFGRVSYWQEKRLLLGAIDPDYYHNKKVILALLGIPSQLVDGADSAKKDMWNHQVKRYNMGDDILSQTSKSVLEDLEFASNAIVKYNRTYLYLPSHLQGVRRFALLAAKYETDSFPHNEPILKYMPENLRNDIEIAALATMRNIENLQYSNNLQNNRYFLIDLLNLLYENDVKYKVLKYMNPELLKDKRFISKLGCFDGLCENFKGDPSFVAFSVENDISILKKAEIFDELIVRSVFYSKDYKKNKHSALVMLFRYIEKFFHTHDEFDTHMQDKKLLGRLYWELSEIASSEFV